MLHKRESAAVFSLFSESDKWTTGTNGVTSRVQIDAATPTRRCKVKVGIHEQRVILQQWHESVFYIHGTGADDYSGSW